MFPTVDYQPSTLSTHKNDETQWMDLESHGVLEGIEFYPQR